MSGRWGRGDVVVVSMGAIVMWELGRYFSGVALERVSTVARVASIRGIAMSNFIAESRTQL